MTRLFPTLAVVFASSPALAATGEHWTRAFSAPLFALAFVWPVLFVALGAAAILRLTFYARRPRSEELPLWPFLALVACAMPVLYLMTESSVSLLAFWPGLMAVTLLWHGRERAKGNAGLRRATPGAVALTLAVLALLAWQAATALAKAAFFAQVTLSPPGPGEPPFARPFDGTKYARPLTADDRLALARFPDPAACLQPRADPATSDGLARMDWDRITAQAEAEVCLFRLLASLPDGMSGFTAFATAQGFTVDQDAFSPTNPFVERDGTLRVTASWSLRRNGPKYPTGGLILILHAIPYGMNVHATYAPDGLRLLHVQIDFSTL